MKNIVLPQEFIAQLDTSSIREFSEVFLNCSATNNFEPDPIEASSQLNELFDLCVRYLDASADPSSQNELKENIERDIIALVEVIQKV